MRADSSVLHYQYGLSDVDKGQSLPVVSSFWQGDRAACLKKIQERIAGSFLLVKVRRPLYILVRESAWFSCWQKKKALGVDPSAFFVYNNNLFETVGCGLSLFDLETFVAQSHIQHLGVVGILLFIQGIFHQLQVTVDCVAQHLFAILFRLGCAWHLSVEEIDDVYYFLMLLAIQIQVFAQSGYVNRTVPFCSFSYRLVPAAKVVTVRQNAATNVNPKRFIILLIFVNPKN